VVFFADLRQLLLGLSDLSVEWFSMIDPSNFVLNHT